MTGQVMLSVAYGIDVRPEGDPYVEETENALRALTLGSQKGAALFDTATWSNATFFPCLKNGISIFTDVSHSTPYAEMVPRSALQTSCALHYRSSSTGGV